MAKPTLKATVFIPTYNGEHYLKELLEAVFEQKADFAYEVLIIDSGSTDGTLDIIKTLQANHANLRLHNIPNSEFGHGKTRNLAASMANGEVVVYLSHDATPSHKRWLYEMLRPFEINDKIVGVMGKQIPRTHCIPMLKSEIRATFASFGPDIGTTLFYNDYFAKDQGMRDALGFYSDVNSAARRDYLLGKFPYKDVAYSEDQMFGDDIISAGYYKVYAPRGSVVHSNDIRFKDYKHRMFDETRGLLKVGRPVAIPRLKTIAKVIVRGVIRDTRNILRDNEYTTKRKLYWLAVNPLFHIEKWRGIRAGAILGLQDGARSDSYSLEKRRALKQK